VCDDGDIADGTRHKNNSSKNKLLVVAAGAAL
jgi:hypothetical protein